MKLKLFLLGILINFNLLARPIWETERRKKASCRGAVPLTNQSRIPKHKFITGDAFRAICDHVFDETLVEFDPKKVKTGDTIFVLTDFLDLFFKHVHHLILNQYVLITHNSDLSVPGKYQRFLDENKIIFWFGINPDIRHPKFMPIPIGFVNAHSPCGDMSKLQQLMNLPTIKEHLLVMNFTICTNSAHRTPVYNLFKNQQYCYSPNLNKPFEQYIKDFKSSCFCLSPFGTGYDTHRFWEAIAMGCIPVVQSSLLDDLYSQATSLIIDKWEDINQNFLEQKYQILASKNRNLEILNIEHWSNIIKNASSLARI